MMKAIFLCIASLQATSSLLVGNAPPLGVRNGCSFKTGSDLRSMTNAASNNEDTDMNRRLVLSFLPAAAILSTFPLPALADEATSKKIVVFGGSGYVGAHVDKLLSQQDGVKVVSVSRSSPDDQAAKVAKILGSPVKGVEYVSLDAATDDLSPVLMGADAVVSCVGVAPGGQNQLNGNGAVNIRIADAAKASGIKRFVYISVASSLASSPAKFLLGDYFKGKSQAEAAVIGDFGGESRLVVKPAIIAGGPPGEVRPPGPPGIKPVAVESVAKIVVAGALGDASGSVDGNDAIEAF